MQMHSSEYYTYSVVEEDYFSGDEHIHNGSTMHTMKPHDHSLPKISYNQNHGNGYGGYNNHENEGYMGKYSEARHEEDHIAHGGIMHNDYKIRRPQTVGAYYGGYGAHQGHNGHYNEGTKYGGYGAHQGHDGPHKEGVKYGGYGDHQGHSGPHKEGMNYGGHGANQGHFGSHLEKKEVSFWVYKGIDD